MVQGHHKFENVADFLEFKPLFFCNVTSGLIIETFSDPRLEYHTEDGKTLSNDRYFLFSVASEGSRIVV